MAVTAALNGVGLALQIPAIYAFVADSVDGASRGMASLPESVPLPSAEGFAECFLSGTRQSRICRVPPSAKFCAR